MQTVKYTGGASQRVLSSEDMATLGVEGHEGLVFGPPPEDDPFAELVLEVEDNVAETLTTALKSEFKVVESAVVAEAPEAEPEPKSKKKKGDEGDAGDAIDPPA